jgi:hypothetical protein
MTNIKLIDKLETFATEKNEDAWQDVYAFIENLYDTNAENPNNDGEDYTSDNYCKGVIDYVLNAGRCSEEFIKELEAIIAEHKVA